MPILAVDEEHVLNFWSETLMVWQTNQAIKTLEGCYCKCGRSFNSKEAALVHARKPHLHSTLDAWR